MVGAGGLDGGVTGEWKVAPFRRVRFVLRLKPLLELVSGRVTGVLRGLEKDMMTLYSGVWGEII